MAKYLLILEGYDPSSTPATPSNAELLQMVRQSQFADDVGGIILSDTTPNVALYPILARFRWAKTTSGVLDGLFYYHDGSSWVIERPAPGTVDADSIMPGTITLDKLNPAGDPFDIIRINSGGNGFEFLNIINAIGDGEIEYAKLALASGQNYLLISNGSGAFEGKTAAYVLAALINGGTLSTTINSTADLVGFRNAADGNAYKITVADFTKELIRQLTELTATAAGDFVGVMDVSDSNIVKKVQIQNLLVDTGVTANTYNNPTSVTVNAKGQVTAISTASAPYRPVATASLPTLPGYANGVLIDTGLGAIPAVVCAWLVCTDAGGDAGWAQYDRIPLDWVVFDTTSSTYFNGHYGLIPKLGADAGKLLLIQPDAGGPTLVPNKTTGNDATFTSSKWGIIVNASL